MSFESINSDENYFDFLLFARSRTRRTSKNINRESLLFFLKREKLTHQHFFDIYFHPRNVILITSYFVPQLLCLHQLTISNWIKVIKSTFSINLSRFSTFSFHLDQWRAKQNESEEMNRLSLHATAYEKLLLTRSDDHKKTSIHCFPYVSQALSWIDQSQLSKPAVLVTGSLYLVGAFLKLVQERHHDES